MKRKWLLIIALVTAIFSLKLMIDTYGLFESNKNIGMEADLAKFNISINGDMITGSDATFNVDTFSYEVDPESIPGKFSPDSTAYFEIVIDPNDTGVSFRYDITFSELNIDNPKISLDSVTVDDTNLIRTNVNTYSGVILLSDIDNTDDDNVTIRVNFSWVNDDDNNDNDNRTMNNGNIEIPVSVHLIQYLGEEIEEYIEEYEEDPEIGEDDNEDI